jgi:hypothetical protein
MLEAERQFRCVISYTDLAKLVIQVELDLDRRRPAQTPTQETAILATA